MNQPYIEIVHVSDEDLTRFLDVGPIHRTIVGRIRTLEKQYGIHYVMGDLCRGLPKVESDTPIRVGGALWGQCVQMRCDNLRKSGYMNVVPDRDISFATEDANQDMRQIIKQFYPTPFDYLF